MKRIISIFATALAALAFFSCDKGKEPVTEETSHTAQVVIKGTAEAPVSWKEPSQKLGAIFGLAAGKTPEGLEATGVNGNTATFSGEVTLDDGVTTLSAFYPLGAFKEAVSEKSYKLELKAVQSPSATSFDPECGILVSSSKVVTVSDGSLTIDQLPFVCPLAILKVDLESPEGGNAYGEKVTSMKIEAPETLAGVMTVGDISQITGWSSGVNTVTAQIPAGEQITIGSGSIWLVVSPFTVPFGGELTFTLETDVHSGEAAIVQTVTASAAINIEKGKVNTLGLDLNHKDVPVEPDVDILTNEWAGVPDGDGYTDFSSVKGSSTNALYSGQIAATQGGIQMRANDPAGIVVTGSAGVVKKITVEWNSNTATNRTLNIYGRHTPYTGSTELFSEDKAGNLIGSFKIEDGNGELTFDQEYEYIGFRSNNGALHLDMVTIKWGEPEWTLGGISVTTQPERTEYRTGDLFSPSGAVVTATYSKGAETRTEVLPFADLSFSPGLDTPLTTSDTKVTVTFLGKTAEIPISVSNPTGTEKVDILNNTWLYGGEGSNSTTYEEKTLSAPTSSAKYMLNAAGGNYAIQLRSNKDSGIITTVSGGKVKKVKITWNENCNDRILNVYGSNTAYTALSELYDEAKQGTKVASFAKTDGNAEYTFTTDYSYVAFRGETGGGIYIDEIEITWED